MERWNSGHLIKKLGGGGERCALGGLCNSSQGKDDKAFVSDTYFAVRCQSSGTAL